MTINHDRAQLATLGAHTPSASHAPSAQDGAPVGPVDLDAIEARARKRDTFSMRPLPSCDHPERGHAPACFACTQAARDAEGPTFHTHGRNDVLALVRRVRELEAESAARLAWLDRVRDEIRAVAKSVDVPGGDPVATAKRMANRIMKLREQVSALRDSAALPDQRAPDPTVPGSHGERVERRG